MTNIVLEGPDGSGKTTLAMKLLQALPHHRLKLGEGPPAYPGEIHARMDRFLAMTHTIFDRHPVISQPIFGRHRDNPELPRADQIAKLYEPGRHIFVYCAPPREEVEHQIKAYDTPQHLELVAQWGPQIKRDYASWALAKADYTYQIGDSDLIIERIQVDVQSRS